MEQKKSIHTIFENRPPFAEFRKNSNKKWREEFVARKFREYFQWHNTEIHIPDVDSGDDVFIEHDGKCYPFQITEIAPKNEEVIGAFSESSVKETDCSHSYISLREPIRKLVNKSVKAKDDKKYANQESINLLIYLNPPANYFIDAEIDICTSTLSTDVKSYAFGTISLYTGKEIIFIKGDIKRPSHNFCKHAIRMHAKIIQHATRPFHQQRDIQSPSLTGA